MKTFFKLLLIFGSIIIIASCSPKRAPSRGCDCPGGHGMIKEKKAAEPAAAIYHKGGKLPS